MKLEFNKIRGVNMIQVWNISNNTHFADINFGQNIKLKDISKFKKDLKNKFKND